MNDRGQPPEDATTGLLAEIEALLADPTHAGNPLREPLARLHTLALLQRERMQRLIRISDGYHAIERNRSIDLVEQYDRKLRQLEKLARISDRYQQGLRDMVEYLREASLKDALTGLGNRRYLMQRLEEETERALRTGASFGLITLDIDHFKQINDNYGHDFGDLALRAVAQAMSDQLRSYDLSGRWGGEEFLMVLPDTELAEVREVGERILDAVRGLQLLPHGASAPIRVTASAGATVFQHGDTLAEVLRRADSAMYAAKRGGRDRLQLS